MQWVEGCSEASPISIDPCEVPEGAELWLSKLPTQQLLLVVLTSAPIIGIGAVDNIAFLFAEGKGKFSDLHGEWLVGLEALAEEDDMSIGGPGTIT